MCDQGCAHPTKTRANRGDCACCCKVVFGVRNLLTLMPVLKSPSSARGSPNARTVSVGILVLGSETRTSTTRSLTMQREEEGHWVTGVVTLYRFSNDRIHRPQATDTRAIECEPSCDFFTRPETQLRVTTCFFLLCCFFSPIGCRHLGFHVPAAPRCCADSTDSVSEANKQKRLCSGYS